MKKIRALVSACILILFCCLASQAAWAAAVGKIIPELLPIMYQGGEKLRYAVSYTGGLRLGTLTLEVRALPEPEHFELRALVSTDGGALARVYPIHDVHVTKVRGPARLPYHYEVWQEEGRNYRAHRLTSYNQKTGLITVRKNDEAPLTFPVGAPVHNEFSAFFASRLMPHRVGEDFLVPTFADKKKNMVVVRVLGAEILRDTIYGAVDSRKMTPILKFRGLYDKRGDTIIWYSADECRLPVRINSKILIGSLTARLIAYDNPLCPRYPGREEHHN
ncbi:MAG: DUF3108 domain-containing protein [Desulfobulbaceae bacterium]|jgi:hypothetical protein|nr:DUF3108 domain-containing protein [Desulfobulbaceae bacterium]